MTDLLSRESESRMKENAARALARLKPFFRPDIIRARIKILFPDRKVAEILGILNEYWYSSDEHSARVQLDALKLSDGNLEKLRAHINAAKWDIREVTIPAEQPTLQNVGLVGCRLSDDERDRITNEDVEQFLNWVHQG